MAGMDSRGDSRQICYSIVTDKGESLSSNLTLENAARSALTAGGQEYQIRGVLPEWRTIRDETTLAKMRASWAGDQRAYLRIGCRTARVVFGAGDTAGYLMITAKGRAGWAVNGKSIWGTWDHSRWLFTTKCGRVFSPSCDYRLWVRNRATGRNDWACTWIMASVEPSDCFEDAETAIFQRIVFGDEWRDPPSVMPTGRRLGGQRKMIRQLSAKLRRG